jgi:hypothetical protein
MMVADGYIANFDSQQLLQKLRLENIRQVTVTKTAITTETARL